MVGQRVRRVGSAVVLAMLGASLLGTAPAVSQPVRTAPVPAGPVWIQTTSTGDDPVGLGATNTFVPSTHDFAASATDRQLVVAAGGPTRIIISLQVPVSGPTLGIGHHDAVWVQDQGPEDALLSVTIDGRSCYYNSGSFDIDEISYADGELATLSLRFQQDCVDPTGSLLGEVRWDASAPRPTNFPPPTPTSPDGFFQAPPGAMEPNRDQLFLSQWAPVTGGASEPLLVELQSVGSSRYPADEGGGGHLEVEGSVQFDTVLLPVTFTFEWSNRQLDLLPGRYADLPKLSATKGAGGFGMFIPPPPCQDERRDVVIDELDPGEDGITVEDLSMRFLRSCGPGQRYLGGEVHWQSPVGAGVPSAPTGVTSTAGEDSATVGWTAPSSTGASPITGYEVTTYVDGMALEPSTTVGPSVRSTTITGLAPGHVHTFKVAATNATGTGRRTGAPPAMVPGPDLGPFATVSAFVEQQYRDVAGRAPTAAEAAAQAAALRLGTTTPQELIRTLQSTAAWQRPRASVVRLYAAYLARTPDTAGLEHWVQAIRKGASIAKVSAAFASSSEFVRRYGALDDAGFVARVYENVLGRAGDAAGLAYWTRRLSAGASRGAVMAQFSESSEHVRRTKPTTDVVLTYTSMLRRVPTATELGNGSSAGRSLTPAGLVRTVLTGTEYARRIR